MRLVSASAAVGLRISLRRRLYCRAIPRTSQGWYGIWLVIIFDFPRSEVFLIIITSSAAVYEDTNLAACTKCALLSVCQAFNFTFIRPIRVTSAALCAARQV